MESPAKDMEDSESEGSLSRFCAGNNDGWCKWAAPEDGIDDSMNDDEVGIDGLCWMGDDGRTGRRTGVSGGWDELGRGADEGGEMSEMMVE